MIENLAFKNKISKVLTLNSDSTGSLLEEAEKCAPTFETVHKENNDLAALLYSSGIQDSQGNYADTSESLK